MDSAAIQTAITVAGSLGGVGLGGYLSSAAARSARRDAARANAVDLLSEVADGVAALEGEIAAFHDRRVSGRANVRGLGPPVLELIAGVFDGHPWKGAAAGLREAAAWDAAEQDRYQQRVRAVVLLVNPALVRLNAVPDSSIRRASVEVRDELAKLGSGVRVRGLQEIWRDVEAAVGRLTVAVHAYDGRRRHRYPWRRSATGVPGAAPRGELPGAATAQPPPALPDPEPRS